MDSQSNEDRSRLLDFLHAFEQQWRSGIRPDLARFLMTLPEQIRHDVVVDLIRIDCRFRREQGESPQLRDYARLAPDCLSQIVREVAPELSSRNPSESPTISARSGVLPQAEMFPAEYRSKDVVGRFVLEEVVGQGAFGVVWRADDPKLKRKVAVKFPHARHNEQVNKHMLWEAQKAAGLQHPHIVPVHDVGEHNGHVYLVSRLLPDGTLRQRMSTGLMPLEEALALMIAICEAVEFAHRQGVLHRDLKPGNILMSPEGQPMVTDFGLAQSDQIDGSVLGHSSVGGTPAYMAPEQVLGTDTGSEPKSDVYALGVILYEVLTGHRPRGGSTLQEVFVQCLAAKPPVRPQAYRAEIPAALEQVCLKAIALEPGDRFQSAADLAEQLHTVLDRLQAPPPPVLPEPATVIESTPAAPSQTQPLLTTSPPPVSGGSWSRLTAWGLGGAALLILTLGLAASGFMGPDGRVEVFLQTDPPATRLVFIPLAADTGFPRPEAAVEAVVGERCSARLLPGEYLVEAIVNDEQFHEVYRTVPSPEESAPRGPFGHTRWKRVEEAVELPEITIPPTAPAGLIQVPENLLHHVFGTNPPLTCAVPDSLMTGRLVMHSDWKPVRLALPRLEEQMEREAVLKTAITTGLAPLSWVSWDEAMTFAEKSGCRLPDEYELELARATTDSVQFPALAEWTVNWPVSLPLGPDGVLLSTSDVQRVARGPFTEENNNFASPRRFLDRRDVYSDVGFRLMRSPKPRLTAEDFVRFSPAKTGQP